MSPPTTDPAVADRSIVEPSTPQPSTPEPSTPEPSTEPSRAERVRLLAVDGHSLAYRAFHSTRHDAEAGPRPITGAVISMLASIFSYGPYDGAVVGFDHPINHRKLDHPEYKANREATDPRLISGLSLLRQDLADCGFVVVEEEGAEADDLVAAVVDRCLDLGWRCDILSSDRDLTALVTDGVRLLRPRATFADLVVEDVEQVRRTYGIEPEQYSELAALRGDPSDGLEGVVGVGPVMAARLLRDYGSIRGIYDELINLPPKLEAALRAARHRVERNVLLMAPIPHLTVDAAIAVERGFDLDRITSVLGNLGLDLQAQRLRRAITSPLQIPPVPPPPDAPTDDDHTPLRATPRGAPLQGEQATMF